MRRKLFILSTLILLTISSSAVLADYEDDHFGDGHVHFFNCESIIGGEIIKGNPDCIFMACDHIYDDKRDECFAMVDPDEFTACDTERNALVSDCQKAYYADQNLPKGTTQDTSDETEMETEEIQDISNRCWEETKNSPGIRFDAHIACIKEAGLFVSYEKNGDIRLTWEEIEGALTSPPTTTDEGGIEPDDKIEVEVDIEDEKIKPDELPAQKTEEQKEQARLAKVTGDVKEALKSTSSIEDYIAGAHKGPEKEYDVLFSDGLKENLSKKEWKTYATAFENVVNFRSRARGLSSKSIRARLKMREKKDDKFIYPEWETEELRIALGQVSKSEKDDFFHSMSMRNHRIEMNRRALKEHLGDTFAEWMDMSAAEREIRTSLTSILPGIYSDFHWKIYNDPNTSASMKRKMMLGGLGEGAWQAIGGVGKGILKKVVFWTDTAIAVDTMTAPDSSPADRAKAGLNLILGFSELDDAQQIAKAGIGLLDASLGYAASPGAEPERLDVIRAPNGRVFLVSPYEAISPLDFYAEYEE